MKIKKLTSIILAALNLGYATLGYANVNPIAPLYSKPSVQLRKLEYAHRIGRTKLYDENSKNYRTPLFLDRSEENPPSFEFVTIKCGGEEHTYLMYNTFKDVLFVNILDESTIKSIKNPTIEQILHLMSNAPECKEK